MALSATIAANGIKAIDSEDAAGPWTIEFPDSTLIVEGTTASVFNVSRTGTTTVTFNANSGSAADEIIDPTSRGSVPASTTGAIVITRAYIQWMLFKTGYVNPTWLCMHYEAQ